MVTELCKTGDIFFYFQKYFGSLAKARGEFSEVMGVFITFFRKLNGIY